MRRKRNNKNLSKFVIYILYITTITFLGLSSIYIKNEVIATSSEITKLNEVYVSNLNIVKELQSNKEYLLSEKYINEFLGNKMSVVVPETLLIQVDLSKWENFLNNIANE